MQQIDAFILSSHWVSEESHSLQYYCCAADGPIVLKFNTEKFVFFAETRKMDQRFSTKFTKKDLPLKSFDGLAVSSLYTKNSNDFFNLKKELAQSGVRTFENDIWPTDRFLMERFIYGSLRVHGEIKEEGEQRVIYNPQVLPCDFTPKFNICSLDIETGVDGSLYSIGVHYSGKIEHEFVFMLSDENKKIDEKLSYFKNEKELLESFIEDLRQKDPDIIIGWHVIGFDLKFLLNKCIKLGIKLSLGRDGSEISIDEKKGSGFFANIKGRVVVDGPPTFRSAFYQFKNFKLETVASELLGVGKDIASDAGKVDEIERRFREDKVSLAKYNLLDCKLVTDLYEKVDLLGFLINRVKVSGLLMDRLGISAAALDHVFLPPLHRRGFVAPNSSDIDREDPSTGGMVIEPSVGLHENVAVFDFRSLYPSIIRTFCIDPFSRVMAKVNPIHTPVGIDFSRSNNMLPEVIEKLLMKRGIAKQNNDHSMNMAIKILMNSFYGLMGSFRCRFYHSDLPKAITQTGHWLLKQTIEFFENRDLEVLYGDTDSIFVRLPENNKKLASKLTEEANTFITRLINDEFKTDSYLELEFEKLYSKIYFSSVRGASQGAKKKYVGLLDGQLQFVGMEFVRSDWTDLAKKFQYSLFENYFMGASIESYIKEFVAQLKLGKFDEDLLITKRLSKDPKEYVKNIPPHVRAALLVNHTGPYRLKEVTYVMTMNGPEPIQMSPKNYDYNYYIDKQIKPLADQVLNSLGKSFDSISLGDQLSLI